MNALAAALQLSKSFDWSCFSCGVAVSLLLLLAVHVYQLVCRITQSQPSWQHECTHGCTIDLPDISLSEGDGDEVLRINEIAIDEVEEEMLQRFRRIIPEVEQIEEDEPWEVCAGRLRLLLKQNYLRLEELGASEAFFAAHRVLAKLRLGSLGIRLTVQYNLFAGSIMGLGSERQVQWLHEVQQRGELGCFLLTEQSAGVLSGLVVETVAQWDQQLRVFVLNTPAGEEGGEFPPASKMWISQGLSAKWGICIARLMANGSDHGPHAFLLDMESEGVVRGDMGGKTTFNGLDNAFVRLDGLRLPADALLSKFCRMNKKGDYEFEGDRPPTFLMVAQRLLSGRICISDAAISYFGTVLDDAEAYCAQRMVWVDQGQQMSLRALPYMQNMFLRFRSSHHMYRMFLLWLQAKYRQAIQQDCKLSREVVNLIAAAKIEAVEFCINALHLLRRNVGAYGLMQSGPFGSTNEILLCCRFAEGDSRILQQMLVRDLLRTYQAPKAVVSLIWQCSYDSIAQLMGRKSTMHKMKLSKSRLLLRLMWFLRRAIAGHGAKKGTNPQVQAWLAAGDLVYDLAKMHAQELICAAVVESFGDSSNSERFAIMSLNDCEMCHQY